MKTIINLISLLGVVTLPLTSHANSIFPLPIDMSVKSTCNNGSCLQGNLTVTVNNVTPSGSEIVTAPLQNPGPVSVGSNSSYTLMQVIGLVGYVSYPNYFSSGNTLALTLTVQNGTNSIQEAEELVLSGSGFSGNPGNFEFANNSISCTFQPMPPITPPPLPVNAQFEISCQPA